MPKAVQQHIDSLTRVNPTRTHGLGLWGNQRVVFGVRVDEKLAKAFTTVAKAKFGSTCNPIEAFMAAVVGCYSQLTLEGVNPSITIGEIRIERNLRERRKLVVEREINETVEVAPFVCACGRRATRKNTLNNGQIVWSCSLHAPAKERVKMWKPIK